MARTVYLGQAGGRDRRQLGDELLGDGGRK
jgi:hypothetical protein